MSFSELHEKYTNAAALLDEAIEWIKKDESKTCINCKYFNFPKMYCNKWEGNPPKEEIKTGCESYQLDVDWFYRLEPRKRQQLPQVLADLANKPHQTELTNHLAEYHKKLIDRL